MPNHLVWLGWVRLLLTQWKYVKSLYICSLHEMCAPSLISVCQNKNSTSHITKYLAKSATTTVLHNGVLWKMIDCNTFLQCSWIVHKDDYCQASNISGTIVGNKLADHSDVFGASPVGTAKTPERRDEKHLSFEDLVCLYWRIYGSS